MAVSEKHKVRISKVKQKKKTHSTYVIIVYIIIVGSIYAIIYVICVCNWLHSDD